MTPDTRYQDMTMDCGLQKFEVLVGDLGMDLGWYHDVYAAHAAEWNCAKDAVNIDVQQVFRGEDGKTNLTSTTTVCTQLPLSANEHGSRSDIVGLSGLWPASRDKESTPIQSPPTETLFGTHGGLPNQWSLSNSSPSEFSLRLSPTKQALSTSAIVDTIATRRSRSMHTSISASTTSEASVDVPPIESEKTRRARYAANQRHSKAREARKDSHHADSKSEADTLDQERKKRHREKNKVAAAKCRSRQRKQVQTIQEKGSRLGEKNAELKAMIKGLRGELNDLRSIALDHQQCSCHVVRYNLTQAVRIAAEYRSFCFGQQSEGFEQLHQEQ